MPKTKPCWLDSKTSRVIAIVIFAGTFLLAIKAHNTYKQEGYQQSQPPTTSEYLRCTQMRSKAIKNMLSEDIITKEKALLFQERAVALCSDQFKHIRRSLH